MHTVLQIKASLNFCVHFTEQISLILSKVHRVLENASETLGFENPFLRPWKSMEISENQALKVLENLD